MKVILDSTVSCSKAEQCSNGGGQLDFRPINHRLNSALQQPQFDLCASLILDSDGIFYINDPSTIHRRCTASTV